MQRVEKRHWVPAKLLNINIYGVVGVDENANT